MRFVRTLRKSKDNKTKLSQEALAICEKYNWNVTYTDDPIDSAYIIITQTYPSKQHFLDLMDELKSLIDSGNLSSDDVPGSVYKQDSAIISEEEVE
jgi:hypothetical protein